MRVFFALLVLLSCYGIALAENPDPNVIWSEWTVDAYVQAIRQRDLPGMTKLLTEDFVADYRSECGGAVPVSHGKCEHLLGWAGHWLTPDSLSCSIGPCEFVTTESGDWLASGVQFFLTIHFPGGPMKIVHTKEFLIVENPSGRPAYRIARITTFLPSGPPQ